MRLAHVGYLVRDYDEAIRWFAEKLGFMLVEDAAPPSDQRWVVVAPPGGGPALLLARASAFSKRRGTSLMGPSPYLKIFTGRRGT